MRSSSASSSATSSLSVKASKTGLAGKKSIASGDGGGGGSSLLRILLSSIIASDTDLRTLPPGAVCLQRSQDSDALPG